jgi:hypothetical protein
MVLQAGKLTKLVGFQARLKVEKGWVVMFGVELVLLQLTKALIFKLR